MSRVYHSAGVWASGGQKKGWVQLYERGVGIDIEKPYETLQLTVDEARTLARQLYRLARRTENNFARSA